MSFASDVYGPNMTETQARVAIGGVPKARGHVPVDRARSSALNVVRGIECDGCGRITKTGIVVPGAMPNDESRWICGDNCR